MDEEFNIEAVIDKRTHKGQTEYFVKWLGFSNEDNTWETIEDIVEQHGQKFIEEYEARITTLTGVSSDCECPPSDEDTETGIKPKTGRVVKQKSDGDNDTNDVYIRHKRSFVTSSSDEEDNRPLSSRERRSIARSSRPSSTKKHKRNSSSRRQSSTFLVLTSSEDEAADEERERAKKQALIDRFMKPKTEAQKKLVKQRQENEKMMTEEILCSEKNKKDRRKPYGWQLGYFVSRIVRSHVIEESQPQRIQKHKQDVYLMVEYRERPQETEWISLRDVIDHPNCLDALIEYWQSDVQKFVDGKI